MDLSAFGPGLQVSLTLLVGDDDDGEWGGKDTDSERNIASINF